MTHIDEIMHDLPDQMRFFIVGERGGERRLFEAATRMRDIPKVEPMIYQAALERMRAENFVPERGVLFMGIYRGSEEEFLPNGVLMRSIRENARRAGIPEAIEVIDHQGVYYY